MRENNSRSRSEELDRGEADETSRRDHFANDFRLLRQEFMPYAEALGIYTDEDVFRATESGRRSRPA